MNIKVNKSAIILTALFWMYATSYAYNLRQISNKDNLSNSSIESLYQDKRGLLWIGTCDGLNVYNGRKVSLFQPADPKMPLTGNLISNIIETDEDILWIHTYYGLNKVNKKDNTVKHFNEFKKRIFLDKDKRNNLLVIEKDDYLKYYDKSSDTFKIIRLTGIDIANIINFTVDEDNRVWLFTKTGDNKCYKIVYSNDEINLIPEYSFKHSTGIKYCYTSENNAIILDYNNLIHKYNLHNKTSKAIYNLNKEVGERGDISTILCSGKSIFIAYKTNGVQILNKAKVDGADTYIIEDTPINCGVFSLIKDRYQDIIWIGTDGQGVYSLSKDEFSIKSFKTNELSAKIGKPVRSLFRDKENSLWIGTKGDGVLKIQNFDVNEDIFKAKTELITTTNSSLSDNSVYSFSKSRMDILWIGTETGLNYYSYKDKQIKTVNLNDNGTQIKYIHDVYEDGSTLWLATLGMGVVRVNMRPNMAYPIVDSINRTVINDEELPSNFFFKIYPENDSIIWFANRGHGTFKLNTHTNNLKHIRLDVQNNNKLLDESFSITKENGYYYFGTSAGLIEYDLKNHLTITNSNDGFANNTIHAILRGYAGNGLWLSTNSGVINYNPSQNTFRNYGLNDGLDIIEFSDGASYQDDEEESLFFGGINGFISIKKNEYHSTHYMPLLTFDELAIYGKDQNIREYMTSTDKEDIIKLSYKQNFLSISFNVMDFLNANNYIFNYKIGGSNEQWIDNGNSNTVSLTNLAPGRYNLQVKYSNKVFGTESDVYTLVVDILPPWYLSKLAYATYTLIGMFIIAMLLTYLRTLERRRKKRFVKEIETIHKEDIYESKLRFFTSMAHEFCTPLTLISGPCDQILANKETSPIIQKYAQVIHQNTERLNTLIQDLIEFRRIDTDNKPPAIEELNITALVTDIYSSFKEQANIINAQFDENIAKNITWNSDKSFLTSIITNLLSNAFKYMSEERAVRLEVSIDNEILKIKISNTGKGIKEKDIYKIFDRHRILDSLENQKTSRSWSRNGLGLAISSSMTNLLQGKIEVESEPDKWTHFIVSLPLLELSDIDTNKVKAPAITAPEINIIKNEYSAKPSITAIDKTKRTILVIDDEEEILWLIADIFKDDFNVVTTSRSAEVESILYQTHPDIILCDITMPDIDGIQLTEQIKAHEHTAHIPLILISAKQGVDAQIEGMNAGAELYITKPFNVGYLKSSVNRLMNTKEVLKQYFASPLSAFDLNDGKLTHKEDNRLIRNIQEIINNNINDKELNATFIAAKLNISTRNLYRKLAEVSETSIADMVRDSRLHIAENLLIHTKKTIDEVINDSGFTNRVSFYKAFSKKQNCTPSEYRDRHSI